MKRTIAVVFAGATLCAGLAQAGGVETTQADTKVVTSQTLQVKERLQQIAEINVTAEKPIDESLPAPEQAVADVLAAIEAAEAE